MKSYKLCRACSQACLSATNITRRRWLHTTIPKSATPIAHPPAPGPPPPVPTKQQSETEDRIERKRALAARIAESRVFKPDAKKPVGLKQRFWKDVSVKETTDGFQIFLDTRPVRDSQKRIITIPLSKPYLATALALEWDQLTSAQQATRQFYIPLTSLVARALDIQTADEQAATARTSTSTSKNNNNISSELRQGIIKTLLRYLSTDTLLCWAPLPEDGTKAATADQPQEPTLRSEQQRLATPIITYLTQNVWPGTTLVPVLDDDSILPRAQPAHSINVIAGWLAGLPAFELAAVERGVLASKSLLAAVRLVVEWSDALRYSSSSLREVSSSSAESQSVAVHEQEHEQQQQEEEEEHEVVFGIEQAAEVVTAEVRWQTQMWGEVEDTHDVEKADLQRQLGSVILLVNGTGKS